MSESGQRARQGADHVGQSASFRKRNALGCRKSDMHCEESLLSENSIRLAHVMIEFL